MSTNPLPQIVAWLDRPRTLPTVAAYVSLILIMIYFPDGLFTGNEEDYFRKAWATVSRVDLGPYDVIIDPSHLRLLSDVIIGAPIAVFGFETAHFLLRLIVAFLMSGALTWMLMPWTRSLLDLSILVSVFWLSGQQFFGGEWILGGVEGKAFAYISVFLAFGFVFRRRLLISATLFVIATYFHLLVGGFWCLAGALWVLLDTRQLREPFLVVFLYIVGVSPLIVLAFFEQQQHSPTVAAGSVTADYIYSILRNPHHVAPFSNKFLLWRWLPGLAAAVSVALALMYLRGKMHDRTIRRLIDLCLILFGYLVIALLLSALDAKTGHLGKFYLFRPTSFLLLLCLLVGLLTVRHLSNNCATTLLGAAFLCTVPYTFAVAAKDAVDDYFEQSSGETAAKGLIQAIGRHTDGEDLVVLEPGRDMDQPYASFSRKFSRPMLSSWKFIPTTSAGILEWHRRERFRGELFAEGCVFPLKYPVQFLVFFSDSENAASASSCGPEIWRDEHFVLVAVGPA